MGERWILAVDLGNGGPKVAVVSLQGDVLSTAMHPVQVHIGLDGAATQDATQWWIGVLSASTMCRRWSPWQRRTSPPRTTD